MMVVPAVASVPVPVPVPVTRSPFSAGGSIRETFSIWRDNLVPFALVAALLNAPNLAATLLQRGPADGGGSPRALVSLAAGIFQLAMSALAAGALTHGTFEALAGRRPITAELLSAGALTFWRVFVVTLNASLRTFLWSLLLVVPGIAAACRYVVAVPAAIATGGGSSSEALARSESLTAGHRWSIFLLVACAYGVPFAMAFGFVFSARGEPVARPRSPCAASLPGWAARPTASSPAAPPARSAPGSAAP